MNNIHLMRRTRDPVAKRAALHASAFQLFSDKRYEDVPVSEIARQAGVAVGTFYRFYPTKMAMLEAMSDALEVEFINAMRKAWQLHDAYPDKFAALACALFDVIEQHGKEIVVMQMTAGHRAAESRPMGSLVRAEIATLYQQGKESGALAEYDPATFAAAAHGLIDGLMQQYLARHNVMTKRDYTRLAAQMLFRLACPD